MGAKKKNKGNKLSKMSEEEKMRYLQHRAAIEEEARRRKEQLISTFLKNKLKREQIFSRLNEAKINQQWRHILRHMKCIELRQDLEDLLKWFDYTVNKKNEKIEALLGDLEEAGNQYSHLHWNQMETIDKFIKIHQQRIDHFYRHYKAERNDVRDKAVADIEDINESFTKDGEQLQAALFRMQESFADESRTMTARHTSKMDEHRNNMLTDMENLKNSRESQIEKIWHDFEATLRDYWNLTEERRLQYLVMRDSDHENCRQIFENNEQINGIIDVIGNLKDQLTKVQASSLQKIANYKGKRETTRKIFCAFKRDIIEEMETDRKNLNFMNAVAGDTTTYLKKILAMGEDILQMQLLCRKLETLDEKILPEGHDKTQLTAEEEADIEDQARKFAEALPESSCSDVAEFEGFWKRYNRVYLEKEALTLHYQSLLKEQKYLKNSLKGYFSSYTVRQPESKVSYANGVRMSQRRRPVTSYPAEVKRGQGFSAVACTEASQSPSIREILRAEIRRL